MIQVVRTSAPYQIKSRGGNYREKHREKGTYYSCSSDALVHSLGGLWQTS